MRKSLARLYNIITQFNRSRGLNRLKLQMALDGNNFSIYFIHEISSNWRRQTMNRFNFEYLFNTSHFLNLSKNKQTFHCEIFTYIYLIGGCSYYVHVQEYKLF